MLTNHRKPVSLSLISTDLPIWSVVETAATLYQKDRDRFHLLLSDPPLQDRDRDPQLDRNSSRLLWLEISPHRAILTLQTHGKFSYRHLWENQMYGLSRFWLHGSSSRSSEQLRLRNFTTSLKIVGKPLPELFRLEYELWSENVQLGSYILNLEIHH